MQVKILKRLLERLRDSYSAIGAVEPSKDMRRVVDLLKGHEDETVGEFIAETKARLEGQNSPDTSEVQTAADKVVADHVRRLLDAGTDRSGFNAAWALLNDDAEVGKLELFAIANRYRNEPSGGTHAIKFKSLRQARTVIRDVFLERADAERKSGAIERLTKRAS